MFFSLLKVLRGLHLLLWIAAVIVVLCALYFLARPLIASSLMYMMGGQYLITSALALLGAASVAFLGWLATAICRAIWDAVRHTHLPSDHALEKIAADVQGGLSGSSSTAPKFVLFLNSQEVEPPIMLLGQSHWMMDFPLTINEAVAVSFPRSLPLVGVLEDEAKRRRGVAEIFVSRQTKTDVLSKLWDKCTFAIVVPGAAESLLQEIAHASVHPERARKIVLIKPPNVDEATTVEWDVARDRAQTLNVALPEDPKGVVFTLAGEKIGFDQPKMIAPLVRQLAPAPNG